MNIFKAYDIRGIFPDEITPEIVRKVGFAVVRFTGAKTVAVGRDMRPSGDVLFPALCEGIAAAGARIVDVGLVSTPLFYFAVQHYPAHDAGVMVTASHNPAQYNGLKLLHGDGAPIGGDSGLLEIERMVREMADIDSVAYEVERFDALSAYVARLYELVLPDSIAPLRVVVDAGNGMAGHVAPAVFAGLSCHLMPIFFELDGTFPHHEANPIKPENMRDLQRMVLETGADIGVAFDGDADRVGFVDERGEIVSGDIMTALIAREVLRDHPGQRVLYDLRSSKAVAEVVREAGGVPAMTRVGHSFIKKQMREEHAVCAGEVSGHYYFSAFGNLDVSDYALLLVLRMLSREQQPFSVLVSAVKRYAHSGEINFDVQDKQLVIDRLISVYKDRAERLYDFDGILCDFGDWWFNVRPSNTEPVLRLNMEARDETMLAEKKMEVIGHIIRDVV